MIHGLTEIITKTKYGRVDRLKSENVFQGSVVAESLRDFGYGNANILPQLWNYDSSARKKPPCTEIIGGIFLFRDRIEEGNQFMPAGNRMLGNGAFGVSNSGEPNELGTFNEGQSILDNPSTIRFVYDFNQNQGNGDINCVCLTSRTGGYIGYGNEGYKQTSSLWNLYKNAGLSGLCPQVDSSDFSNSNNIVCNGALYNFTLSGTDLLVKKVKIPLKNASIFDGIQVYQPAQIIDVSHKNYSFFTNQFRVSAYNGKIYLSNSNVYAIITLGTYYIWEYDTATGNLTELTFTDSENYRTWVPFVAQGKAFFQHNYNTGRGGMKVYNLDGSQYDFIDSTWDSGNSGDTWGGDFGNHVLMKFYRDYDEGYRMYLYDVQSKKLRPINATTVSASGFAQCMRQEETSKAITYPTNSSYGIGNAYAFNNPLYLATINNLSEVKHKDESMTMQVRYTLTES